MASSISSRRRPCGLVLIAGQVVRGSPETERARAKIAGKWLKEKKKRLVAGRGFEPLL